MDVRSLRAEHYGLEEVDLTKIAFTPKLLACVPAEVARQCRVLPLFDGPKTLKVVIADPSDVEGIELMRNTIHRDIDLCVADEMQLAEFIRRFYGSEDNPHG
jgi:type IV pilus assembly protein PilB